MATLPYFNRYTRAPLCPATGQKFNLGQTVVTPAVQEFLLAKGVSPFTVLARHRSGDWGTLDAEDRTANEQALTSGARLFSVYEVGGEKIWIITDAADDSGVRPSTCLLFPQEY